VLATTLFGVIPVYLLATLAVRIAEDLPLTTGRLGFLVALFWGTAAAASWPAGQLVGRMGARRGMLVGCGLSAISSASAALAESVLALGAAMVFGGCANAVIVPACNVSLTELPTPRQGMAFGMKQSALSLSILVSGIVVPLASYLGTWRVILAAAAIGALGAAPWTGDRSPRTQQTIARQHRPTAVSRRSFVLLSVAAGMASATNTVLTGFFVVSAVSAGVDPGVAGFALSAGALVGAAARLIVGRHAGRSGGTDLRAVAVLLLLGAPGFALMGFAASPVALVLGSLLAFGAGWSWTGLFHMSVVRLRPQNAAEATGSAQTSLFLGGMLGPIGFAAIATHSFRLAWLLSAAWLTGSAIAIRLVAASTATEEHVSQCASSAQSTTR
jgi:MFS family permease